MLTRRQTLMFGAAFCSVPAVAEPPLKILFIGNSFTLQHDVPGLVADLIDQAGIPVQTAMVARNNVFLSDLAPDRSTALNLVWDHDPAILVLQEHSRAALNPDTRARSLKAIHHLRSAGVPTVLFAPWPRRANHALYQQNGMPRNPEAMVNLTEDHLIRAAEFDRYATGMSEVARIGRAWLLGQGLSLYKSDGYHATLSGAWLAALVIARSIGLAPERPQAPDGVSAAGRMDQIARTVAPPGRRIGDRIFSKRNS